MRQLLAEHGAEIRDLAARGAGFGIVAATGTGKTLAIRSIAETILAAPLRIGVVNRERIALNHEWLWRGEVRSREAEKNAHLLPEIRQLLLAGAAYAETELAARGNASRNIDVPLPSSVDGTLHLQIGPGPTSADATVQIQATVASQRARQLLTFTRTGETWRITAATLIQ